jgi:hypothetical protein
MKPRSKSPLRTSRAWTRRIAILGALSLGVTAGSTGCKKDGTPARKKSERLKWVEKPTTGSQSGKVVKIPGLQVTFEQPEVLYVYKKCSEAAHSPHGEEGWIPVIRCETAYGSEDELSDEAPEVTLTVYVAERDPRLMINERGVQTLESMYIQNGYEVANVMYIEDYQSKAGRRGIESIVHQMDAENRYPEREIQRFRFPAGDVIFIAEIDYPYGDDRSGIANDWQRILWNFQLDEDGPLYPDAGGEGEE